MRAARRGDLGQAQPSDLVAVAISLGDVAPPRRVKQTDDCPV